MWLLANLKLYIAASTIFPLDSIALGPGFQHAACSLFQQVKGQYFKLGTEWTRKHQNGSIVKGFVLNMCM